MTRREFILFVRRVLVGGEAVLADPDAFAVRQSVLGRQLRLDVIECLQPRGRVAAQAVVARVVFVVDVRLRQHAVGQARAALDADLHLIHFRVVEDPDALVWGLPARIVHGLLPDVQPVDHALDLAFARLILQVVVLEEVPVAFPVAQNALPVPL